MSLIAAHPERKMLLQEVAAKRQRYRNQRLGNGRIEMKSLHKIFQNGIIQPEINAEYHRIAKHLYAPLQVRFGKDQVLIKNKAHKESSKSAYDQRHGVRSNQLRQKRKINLNILLAQNPVVRDIIRDDAAYRRGAARYDIPESVYGQPSGKGWMKEIYEF